MNAINLSSINLEGKLHPVGYKVVTQDLKSLGLKNNSNIIQYPLKEWFYLPAAEVEEGKSHWGGIWVAKDFSNAKKIMNYMSQKYGVHTRIFKSAIDRVLYSTSCRIKTNGVILLEEMFL